MSGETDVDETEFEAAKRSLVFDIISRESTVPKMSQQSLLAYLRGVPREYNR